MAGGALVGRPALHRPLALEPGIATLQTLQEFSTFVAHTRHHIDLLKKSLPYDHLSLANSLE
jgi:hypothetical protein